MMIVDCFDGKALDAREFLADGILAYNPESGLVGTNNSVVVIQRQKRKRIIFHREFQFL